VRDWLAELWVVFCYSTRTQLALAFGVAFFVCIMLTGDVLVGRVELHGSLAPMTDVIREALMHRYDRAAWMALSGLLLVAVRAYRKDRRRLLGI
jgi:uncharacterized membrane protein